MINVNADTYSFQPMEYTNLSHTLVTLFRFPAGHVYPIKILDMAVSPGSLISFWRERIGAVVITQLAQGITPPKVALSIALGISLGVFPVLGTTTTFCAIAAIRLKLIQAIIQFVNWLVYPQQLCLILVYVRLGEWIVRARPIRLSIYELVQTSHESPLKVLQEFWMAQLEGIIAWLFIVPILSTIAFFALVPPLKTLATKAASANSGLDSDGIRRNHRDVP